MPATEAANRTLVNQVLRIISPTLDHCVATSGFYPKTGPMRYRGFLCSGHAGSFRWQRQRRFIRHLLQCKAGAYFLDAGNGGKLFRYESLQRSAEHTYELQY